MIGGQGGHKASGMNLTHTGILGFDADFSVPVVSMTAEDQGQLERFLDRGITPARASTCRTHSPTARLKPLTSLEKFAAPSIPNRFSWSAGISIPGILPKALPTMARALQPCSGAADSIKRSGERPRRTIRFVLFTGEEQGLDGSLAYIKQHQAELPNHLGDLVLDAGQGAVKAFQLGGRNDLVPAFQPFATSISAIRPVQVDDKIESGTDTSPFSIAGLPGINMDQDTSEYIHTHHSAADALEAQKPEVLAQNATLMALAAFWIADRPERFASPLSPADTAKMLRAHHQEEELKAFHLWPFGDKNRTCRATKLGPTPPFVGCQPPVTHKPARVAFRRAQLKAVSTRHPSIPLQPLWGDAVK